MHGTTCVSFACGSDEGACIAPVADDDCVAVGGNWQSAGTLCNDGSICISTCPEDLNGDGIVSVNDVLEVVGDWDSTTSDYDLDGSGVIDTGDLLAVIGAWGQCE